MPVITYLAQRELEAGHTVPTEYKIETIFKSRVRGTKKVGEESRSLDQTMNRISTRLFSPMRSLRI